METSARYFLLIIFITLEYHHRSGLGTSRIQADQHLGDRREVCADYNPTCNHKFSWGVKTSTSSSGGYVVNVDDFGAKGDHKTDDSQAFSEAWNKACSTRGSIFLVPAHKAYRLKPITFAGPCQSYITAKIQGRIVASKNLSDYDVADKRAWIKFANLTDFTVDGGGVFNGNGQIWWPLNCHVNKSRPCIDATTALTFVNCLNLKVSHLELRNAQQKHLNFTGIENVEVSNIKVKTKETSPNTDGIYLANSTNVLIKNCDIKTGDDCIGIVGGSHNVRLLDIKCGPGHGISIGSLGKDGAEDRVSNIVLNRAVFRGSTNGVRIKTWQGGSGYAKDIVFENIRMHNVSNPIVINQFYCDKNGQVCRLQKIAVQVENVLYKNIEGTSATETGIAFNCSDVLPCKGIKLENIHLQHKGNGSRIVASCTNVIGLQQVGLDNTPQCM